MTRLLDVNVLIALTWPHHVHHNAAKSWFAGVRGNGWTTCPLTEAGFVRVDRERRRWPRPSPLRTGDPDPPATHGDERVPVQRCAMFLEYLGHQGEAVANRHIGQPDQACVRCPADVHQSAEVAVERDENPALRGGAFEQRTIAWIGFYSRVGDVVTLGAQPFGQPSACAVVDQELHRLATETAASVSSAIAACA